MKTACVLAVLGSAAAVAPPRIELDLAESAYHDKYEGSQARSFSVDNKLESPSRSNSASAANGGHDSIYREHDQARTNIDHGYHKTNRVEHNGEIKRVAVRSRQDWTEKCAAGIDNKNTCHFPKARAYDFVDQELEVTTRVFKVDEQGKTILQPILLDASEVGNAAFFAKRATYLFKYDATDNSGNHAEQVVFALIMDDPHGPEILFHDQHHAGENHDGVGNPQKSVTDATYIHDDNSKLAKYHGSADGDGNPTNAVTGKCWTIENDCDPNASDTCQMKVEASRSPTWGLYKCTGSDGIAAWDAVDKDVTSTLRYSVMDGNSNKAYVCKEGDSKCPAGTELFHVTPEVVSNYLGWYTKPGSINLRVHAHDNAGVYGVNSRNNQKTVKLQIVVQDTLPPQCFVHGENPTEVECHNGAAYNRCDTTAMWNGALPFKPLDGGSPYFCDGGAGCFDELEGDMDFPESGSPGDANFGSNFDIAPSPNTWTSSKIGQETMTDGSDKKYTITYTATDNANALLVGTATRDITVTDTTPPMISLVGDSTTDLRKSAQTIDGKFAKTQCEKISNGAGSKHSVCAHSAGGIFSDPGIVIDDTCDVRVGEDSDNHNGAPSNIWEDVECPTENEHFVSTGDCWGGKTFNDRKVGKYIRTYNIHDTSGNKNQEHRTFHVVDMTAPIITIFGQNSETFEASRDVEYTDQGAKCMDYVDGDISHNVEVSGEIVNMKVPGTYELQYDCQDNNGNMAPQDFRSIVIVDTGCPHVDMLGDEKVYVEAGFPYADAGATATDTLDGDITSRVRSVGNTVNDNQAFYYAKSCQQIKDIAANGQHGSHIGKVHVPKATINSGEYYITITSAAGTEEAVVVTCDFDQSPATTYFKMDAQRWAQDQHEYGTAATAGSEFETHQHHADTADEAKYGKRYPTCVEYGFVNFETPSTAVKQFATEVFGQSYALTTAARVHTDRRLCTLEDPSAAKDIQTTTLPALRAEVGTYKICYFVKDLEGNTQCEDSLATCRTVEVKDTLPPVLTLKYRGNILNTDSAGNNIMESTTPFHANKASLSPITNKQRNPALFKIGAHTSKHTNFGNPHISSDADAAAAIDGSYQADYSLMAQAATTNGWLIAAVASGIAGVALFSVSLKKSDNQVPVPV